MTWARTLVKSNSGCRPPFEVACEQNNPAVLCVFAGMSVGNFMMSDVTSVMEMVLVLRKFVAVPDFCYINVFLRTVAFGQSMLFIALVAVLRAWGGLSKQYKFLSLKKVMVCVAVVYVLSLAWAGVWVIPSFKIIAVCMGWPTPVNKTVVMIFLSVTLCLFLLTIISYIALGIGIRCRRVQNTIVTGNKKSEILTLRAAVSLSIVFIVGYFIPFLPGIISFPKFVPVHNLLHIYSLFNSFAYVQSAVAPYIYMATNAHFRRAFKITCRKVFCICGNKVGPVNASSTEQT